MISTCHGNNFGRNVTGLSTERKIKAEGTDFLDTVQCFINLLVDGYMSQILIGFLLLLKDS